MAGTPTTVTSQAYSAATLARAFGELRVDQIQAVPTEMVRAMRPVLVAFLQQAYPQGRTHPNGTVVFASIGPNNVPAGVGFSVDTVPAEPDDVRRAIFSVGGWATWAQRLLALENPTRSAALVSSSVEMTRRLGTFLAQPTLATWRSLIDIFSEVVFTIFIGVDAQVRVPAGTAPSTRTNPYVIYGAVGLILLAGGAWLVTRKG